MATTKRPAKKRTPRPVAAAPAKPAATPAETDGARAGGKDKKKAKRVRGEFAMPESDYERIGKLKATARRVGVKVKKNELLRLGLQSLQTLPAGELREAILALRLPKGRAAVDA